MKKQFTLGKNERLKSRKQIEELFNAGRKFTITPFRVHYTFSPITKSYLQFGAGVSNKNFKKAVDRNKIKRRVREAYRLQKSGLQQKLKEKNTKLNIFLIYNGKEIPSFTEVVDQFNKVLEKLNRIIESEN